MNLKVTLDTSDAVALAAFCLATGREDTSETKPEEWLYQQVEQFLKQNINAGLVRKESKPAMLSYQTALVAAAAKAKTDMEAMPISVGVSSVAAPPAKG